MYRADGRESESLRTNLLLAQPPVGDQRAYVVECRVIKCRGLTRDASDLARGHSSCCLVAFLSYSGYGLSDHARQCIGRECACFRNKQNSFNVHHIQYRTERKNERQADIKTTDQGREGFFLLYHTTGETTNWIANEHPRTPMSSCG